MTKKGKLRQLLKPLMVLIALIIGTYGALLYALGELRRASAHVEGEREMSKSETEPEEPFRILKDKLIKKPETKPKETK